MKHENLKGKDHRSDETKERDRKAGEQDRKDNERKLPDLSVNLDGGGRSSGQRA